MKEKELAEAMEKLACAIDRLAHTLDSQHGQQVILSRIAQLQEHIMEAIQSFATRVNTAFDKLSTAVDGVSADVDDLKAQIAALQNSPGTLTAEDQAALDAIQAKADTLATKVDALDAATTQAPKPTP